MAGKQEREPGLTKKRDISDLSIKEAKRLHALGMAVDVTDTENQEDGSKKVTGRLVRDS